MVRISRKLTGNDFAARRTGVTRVRRALLKDDSDKTQTFLEVVCAVENQIIIIEFLSITQAPLSGQSRVMLSPR